MLSSYLGPTMTVLLATLLLNFWAGEGNPPIPPPPFSAGVEFNRDIRPILSDACFSCHGPDAANRKAALRLDTAEGIRTAFASGEAWRRIHDAKKPMPPRSATRQLGETERATLRAWIDAGAKWQPHWAFLVPIKSPVPNVRGNTHTPIDRFLLARLEREGLSMSANAERPTWLRRVTLDLTGVPPTIDEQLAFEADRHPDAYERVVDRLLANPRFGERFAIRWLEAARYADTSGYQSDGERTMWRWRDWVIDAFNANMPFDRFTVEQLAGDLLPGPKMEQRIATGFNRNHRGNAEGGIVPEEYAVEYVADRVETTAAVWLGLTMGCARCHDHKYDPISQREFYRLFAFFNNIPERGKAVKFGNSPPLLVSPTARQQEQLQQLDAELRQAQSDCHRLEPELQAALRLWHYDNRDPLDAVDLRTGAVRHDAARHLHDDEYDGRRHERIDAGAFGYLDRFSLSAVVVPTRVDRGTLFSRMTDVAEGDGYAVRLHDDRLQVNLVKRWLDDAARVETEERLTPGTRRHVTVTYDGSRVASGIRVFLDGKPVALRVLLDDLNQTFATKEPLRVGAGNGPLDRFVGRMSEVRLYSRALDATEVRIAAGLEPKEKKRRAFLRSDTVPIAVREAHQRLARLQQQRRDLMDQLPTTMVMEDMPKPRATHLLRRGQYDQPGERVTPGVPTFAPWPTEAPMNRLGLARWVVDATNPLTARVIVNRFWQMFFGVGLVKTSEDFGVQGEPPTNPELLDWLAVEFRESGWDVKRLVRLIVTSRVYRQSSRQTLPGDSENRLLSRFPRLRLPAEMIRDQALFAAGLLSEELGGPSVKPYQPDGLWRDLADAEYIRDTGSALYRRGLYVYWKRTVAPPGAVTFDAPGREACSVRETRTNTPLQALNLLNDVTYVEAGRVLGERALRAKPDDTQRITWMFRRVLGRAPRDAEANILRTSLEKHRQHYTANRAAAEKIASVGDFASDRTITPIERASFAALAGTLLNLDEAINKE